MIAGALHVRRGMIPVMLRASSRLKRAWPLPGAALLAAPLLFALLLLLLPGAGARADAPAVEITDFSFFAAADKSAQARSDYSWPDDTAISAAVELETSGYSKSSKVELFLVVFDEKDQVFAKTKGRYDLKAGPQRIVFDSVLNTRGIFGERSFRAKVEASMKGAATAREETELTLNGPDPPDVDIVDLELYNGAAGRDNTTFYPGSQFALEATIDVGKNESQVEPQVMVYAAMEEDAYLIDPELEYQPLYDHWDITKLPACDGEFRLRARGSLPNYFAEPYEVHHPFRVYVYVNFGGGIKTSDYARAELTDPRPGDNRVSNELSDRSILLQRAYTWEFKRLHPALP